MGATYGMWQQYIFDDEPNDADLEAVGQEAVNLWSTHMSACGYRPEEKEFVGEVNVKLLRDMVFDDEQEDMQIVDRPGVWTALVIVTGPVVDSLEEAIQR